LEIIGKPLSHSSTEHHARLHHNHVYFLSGAWWLVYDTVSVYRVSRIVYRDVICESRDRVFTGTNAIIKPSLLHV